MLYYFKNNKLSIRSMLFTLSWLFVGGIVTGLYASSVGGGALLTFPLLILAGVPTPVALGSNKLQATILELTSAVKFYKEKKLRVKFAVLFGILGSVGSYIGSNLAIQIDTKVLNIIIAVLLAVMSAVFLYKKDLINEEKAIQNKHLLIASIVTFFLGIYNGFFGAGFGILITFVFLFVGLSFFQSAAVGRVIGFMSSLVAMLVFAYNGSINYPFALALGIGSAIGSWIGISIAIKKGSEHVKNLLLILVGVTIIKLIWGAL